MCSCGTSIIFESFDVYSLEFRKRTKTFRDEYASMFHPYAAKYNDNSSDGGVWCFYFVTICIHLL